MKTTTFEWIMVAVLSIVLICVVVFSIDAHMDRMEAKAESMNAVSIVEAKMEKVNNAYNEFEDAMISFLMSDEYQEWVNVCEESY